MPTDLTDASGMGYVAPPAATAIYTEASAAIENVIGLYNTQFMIGAKGATRSVKWEFDGTAPYLDFLALAAPLSKASYTATDVRLFNYNASSVFDVASEAIRDPNMLIFPIHYQDSAGFWQTKNLAVPYYVAGTSFAAALTWLNANVTHVPLPTGSRANSVYVGTPYNIKMK